MKKSNKTQPVFEINSLKIVELHPTVIEGEEQDDTDGDYYNAIVELNGEEVVRYGDHYHEKGVDKAEGFADGLRHVYELLHGKPCKIKTNYEQRLDESVN